MKRFVILISSIVLVVSLWSGAWLFAANYIDRSISAQSESLAEGVPSFTCGQTVIAGFPFRFDVTCSNFSVTQNDVTIAVPEIKVTALVYRPTHLLAFAQGPATISDTFTGSQNRVDWTSLQASARTNWYKPARFSVIAEDFSLSDTLMSDTLIAKAQHLEAHMVDAAGTPSPQRMNAGVFVKLANAEIPGIQTQSINGDFDGLITALPDDIRAWTDLGLLRYWQAGGGSAIINKLEISAPDLVAQLDGEVSLDEAGMANGKLSLASKGLAEPLQDALPPPYGSLILGAPQEDGSYTQNMAIRSGVVMVGIIPVAQLAPLF